MYMGTITRQITRLLLYVDCNLFRCFFVLCEEWVVSFYLLQSSLDVYAIFV